MEPENTFHLKKKPLSAIRPSSPVEESPRSPHGNPGRAGRQGRRIPLPLPGVHHNAEKQKKSRADSLKSQRHPALEDKFDHCIT
jgi:hypothetical protein